MTPSQDTAVVRASMRVWRRPVKSSDRARVVIVSLNSAAHAWWNARRAAVVVAVMRESSTWSWTMRDPATVWRVQTRRSVSAWDMPYLRRNESSRACQMRPASQRPGMLPVIRRKLVPRAPRSGYRLG